MIMYYVCDNEIKRFRFGFFKKRNKSLCVSFHWSSEDINNKELVRMLQEPGLESFGRWKFEIFIRDWDKIIFVFHGNPDIVAQHAG